jgi:hypothetical protein
MSTLEYSLTIFTAETYPAIAGDGRNALLLGSTLSVKGYGVKIICLNPNGLLRNVKRLMALTYIG